MNEIIYSHLKKVFKVDEAGFADISKQVRDHEFEVENLSAVQLAEVNIKLELQAYIAQKVYRKLYANKKALQGKFKK